VVGAESTQLAFAVGDLAVEFVDQPQAGLDRCLPRFGQPEPGEQLAAADTEEIGDGAGLAVGEQHHGRCARRSHAPSPSAEG
jgi:hypothetical protein